MRAGFASLLGRAVGYFEYRMVLALGRTLGINFVVRYLRNPNPATSVRVLRAFGAKVGTATTIKGSLLLDNVIGDQNAAGDFSYLTIGNNCYVGDAVFIDLANEVVLEDDVVVAARAAFLTHADCGRSYLLDREFPRRCAPLVVQTGSWVGFGTTVLCGVVIGCHSAIGAHSLVTKYVEPHSLYAGSPARKIRSLELFPKYETNSRNQIDDRFRSSSFQ